MTVALEVCISVANWLTFGATGPSVANKYSSFFILDKYFSSICLMSRMSTSIIMFMVLSRFSEKFLFSRKKGKKPWCR